MAASYPSGCPGGNSAPPPRIRSTGPAKVNADLVGQDPSLGWNNYFSPGDPFFGSAGLVVLLFLAHLPFAMNPHIGNKALALRERRHLRTFLLLAIPIGSILGATVLGGLQARALLGPGLRPDAAIPSLFAELFPPVLAGFLGVAILSAVMSTADGLLVSIAVIFSNDLYRKTFAPWIHAHKSVRGVDRISLNVSRVATVGAAVVAATLAWDPPSSSLFCSGLVWGESCRGRQDRFSLVRFGDAPTGPVLSPPSCQECCFMPHCGFWWAGEIPLG